MVLFGLKFGRMQVRQERLDWEFKLYGFSVILVTTDTSTSKK